MLASLGIKPAEPFDWGDEPRMDVGVNTNNKSPFLPERAAPLSGLDALRKDVADQTNEAGDNDKVILRALLEGAGVGPSSPVGVKSESPASQHEERAAAPDGWAMRDVSIRGLSDRAVAELAVEGKAATVAWARWCFVRYQI